MLFAVRCVLVVARCLLPVVCRLRVVFVDCWCLLVFDVCWLLLFVGLGFTVCCVLLCVVYCSLFVVCCSLSVVCCLLCGVRCLLFVV